MRVLSPMWGAAIGGAAILLLAPAIGVALGDLAAARTEQARLAAVTAAPPPNNALVAGAMQAASLDAANTAWIARIRARAARSAVLVEGIAAMPDRNGLARIRMRLSGSEDAVVALADALERETPVARFAEWRVQAAGDAVRFQGELVAPWQR